MNREKLFKKYGVNESHSTWQPSVDNWVSVEIYREMHDGNLPEPDDMSTKYILDFLDKTKDPKYFFGLKNQGSMYLTAKRMVHRYADQILEELHSTQRSES